MTERAAHLVEYVFPDVPVRQWVLTLASITIDVGAPGVPEEIGEASMKRGA